MLKIITDLTDEEMAGDTFVDQCVRYITLDPNNEELVNAGVYL